MTTFVVIVVAKHNVSNLNPDFNCAFVFVLSVDRGMLELKKTSDYGKTIKTVASKIYSFGLGGRFLFASVMTGKVIIINRH